MQLLQRLLLLQQEERKAEKCKGGLNCPLDEGVVSINLAEGEALTRRSTECHWCALGTEKKNIPVLHSVQFLAFPPFFLRIYRCICLDLLRSKKKKILGINFQGTRTHTLGCTPPAQALPLRPPGCGQAAGAPPELAELPAWPWYQAAAVPVAATSHWLPWGCLQPEHVPLQPCWEAGCSLFEAVDPYAVAFRWLPMKAICKYLLCS